MKPFILFLAGALSVCMSACQSTDENNSNEMSDFDIAELGIFKDDANRKLSHKPTGVSYVETENQSVLIDFTLNEILRDNILYNLEYYYDNDKFAKGDLLEVFSTMGKLAAYYNRSQLRYYFGYENYRNPNVDGDIVYAKIEYALAQECFLDECSSTTRKSVLQMVVNKHEPKTEPFVVSYSALRTGLFLMAVILVKEKDAAFLSAVRDNPNFQRALCLNSDIQDWNTFKELSDIYQIAVEFLSHQ